jgi:hypothetical protein
MTASTTVTKSDTKYSKHHAWWMLVLVLVCIPAALVSEPLSESFGQIMPETLPNTSSYNKKASGYSALFELCQKVGIPSHRWEGSYRELIKHTKGTLVIVLPSEPLSRHEVDSLMKWVQQGNDLVYLDYLGYRSGQKVLDPLKLHASSRTEVKDKDIVADSKIPETANAISLRANADVVIFGGEKVIGPDDKSAYLTTLKHGKGRVLVGSLTDFAANRHIANTAYRNNFQFMMNWFDTSQKPILFDEKAHGYTSGSNVWFFILKSPVGFVLFQLALIVITAFISLNQRFGQPRLVSNPRKISNLEFIDGLASTYERARARDTAWSMIFTPLKARLVRSLGVDPHSPLDEVAKAWSEHSGKSSAEYMAFLEDAHKALEARKLTDEELEALIAKADSLTTDSRELQPMRRIMGA